MEQQKIFNNRDFGYFDVGGMEIVVAAPAAFGIVARWGVAAPAAFGIVARWGVEVVAAQVAFGIVEH